MKSVVYGCLSALVLCSSLFTVNKVEASEIKPFNLVQLARKGYFKEHDIPSYSKLNSAVKSGKIEAKNLVEAAIAEKRLSPETLEDDDYLNIVEFKLNRLYRK